MKIFNHFHIVSLSFTRSSSITSSSTVFCVIFYPINYLIVSLLPQRAHIFLLNCSVFKNKIKWDQFVQTLVYPFKPKQITVCPKLVFFFPLHEVVLQRMILVPQTLPYFPVKWSAFTSAIVCGWQRNVSKRTSDYVAVDSDSSLNPGDEWELTTSNSPLYNHRRVFLGPHRSSLCHVGLCSVLSSASEL